MSGTKVLSSFFTVRGTEYLMDAGPDVTTLWRLDGKGRHEVATFGAAWDPNIVLAVADIDAQAHGLKAARKVLKQVFGAGIAILGLFVATVGGVSATEREGFSGRERGRAVQFGGPGLSVSPAHQFDVGRGPDVGPPTDKPGPQQPHDPPAPHDPAEGCPTNQPECRR